MKPVIVKLQTNDTIPFKIESVRQKHYHLIKFQHPSHETPETHTHTHSHTYIYTHTHTLYPKTSQISQNTTVAHTKTHSEQTSSRQTQTRFAEANEI